MITKIKFFKTFILSISQKNGQGVTDKNKKKQKEKKKEEERKKKKKKNWTGSSFYPHRGKAVSCVGPDVELSLNGVTDTLTSLQCPRDFLHVDV